MTIRILLALLPVIILVGCGTDRAVSKDDAQAVASIAPPARAKPPPEPLPGQMCEITPHGSVRVVAISTTPPIGAMRFVRYPANLYTEPDLEYLYPWFQKGAVVDGVPADIRTDFSQMSTIRAWLATYRLADGSRRYGIVDATGYTTTGPKWSSMHAIEVKVPGKVHDFDIEVAFICCEGDAWDVYRFSYNTVDLLGSASSEQDARTLAPVAFREEFERIKQKEEQHYADAAVARAEHRRRFLAALTASDRALAEQLRSGAGPDATARFYLTFNESNLTLLRREHAKGHDAELTAALAERIARVEATREQAAAAAQHQREEDVARDLAKAEAEAAPFEREYDRWINGYDGHWGASPEAIVAMARTVPGSQDMTTYEMYMRARMGGLAFENLMRLRAKQAALSGAAKP